MNSRKLLLAVAMILLVAFCFAQDTPAPTMASTPPSTPVPSQASTPSPSTLAPSSSPSTTNAPAGLTPTPTATYDISELEKTCWTCPAGYQHWWLQGREQPDDKCACFLSDSASTTATPTKASTASPTKNQSGNNNSKSSATKNIAIGGLLVAIAVAAAL